MCLLTARCSNGVLASLPAWFAAARQDHESIEKAGVPGTQSIMYAATNTAGRMHRMPVVRPTGWPSHLLVSAPVAVLLLLAVVAWAGVVLLVNWCRSIGVSTRGSALLVHRA